MPFLVILQITISLRSAVDGKWLYTFCTLRYFWIDRKILQSLPIIRLFGNLQPNYKSLQLSGLSRNHKGEIDIDLNIVQIYLRLSFFFRRRHAPRASSASTACSVYTRFLDWIGGMLSSSSADCVDKGERASSVGHGSSGTSGTHASDITCQY